MEPRAHEIQIWNQRKKDSDEEFENMREALSLGLLDKSEIEAFRKKFLSRNPTFDEDTKYVLDVMTKQKELDELKLQSNLLKQQYEDELSNLDARLASGKIPIDDGKKLADKITRKYKILRNQAFGSFADTYIKPTGIFDEPVEKQRRRMRLFKPVNTAQLRGFEGLVKPSLPYMRKEFGDQTAEEMTDLFGAGGTLFPGLKKYPNSTITDYIKSLKLVEDYKFIIDAKKRLEDEIEYLINK